MAHKPASIELGPYQLMERIGEGGSGHVYRGRGPDGPVAIKMLGPAADMDDAARARFGREVGALRELAHPNLVALLDHGIDAELGPYLVLPLLAGTNLRVLCDGALCPEAAILVALPIVQATAALHAAGYVHRDLKPENVFAAPDGTITVIDLGLAWRDGMTRHTDTGAAVGSVGYMSPEQIEGRRVDERADVWALGVMIYEWIAGKRPFARPRPTEEAAAVLLGQFPQLTAADRRCGAELGAVVARCLALDPQKRPTAAELAASLDAMIDWTDRDAIVRERAAVVADPRGYQARIAPLRVRRLERVARDALEAGQPFAALACCDRGLAYVPDHAELLAIVASAEKATARTEAFAPTVELPRGPRRRRRIAWIAIAAGGIAIGAALTYMLVPERRGGSRDPWAEPSPNAASANVRPMAGLDDRDRELAKGFLSLFGRVYSEHRADEAKKEQRKLAAPPDAAVKTEDAVPALRAALARNPDWVDAQAALCVALVMQGDDAVPECERAVKSRPNDDVLKAALATARLRAGKK